ncbi:MAG TPA: class I SAM-dependent methyltransferase [Thermoanaerobaculia bacterium]|nr:class I SAM-dependent methyltransferase [Thermoanaerobaculia bacterium]
MERHPVYGLSVAERGWVPAPRYALRRARILSILSGLPRGRVLEIGCGAGALLHDLAVLGFACAAVETSREALALARDVNRDHPEVKVFSRPQEGWDEAFDLVLAFEVLEHLEDDAGALRQWRAWLRPDGRLLLSVPARQARWTATDTWAGHLRRYERSGLLALLDRSGFAVEHHECYGFPLSNLTETLRGRVHARVLRRSLRANGALPDAAASTGRSGTDRGFETRLYPLQASWPGVQLFRACCWLQNRFLERELGTGYLILARRR